MGWLGLKKGITFGGKHSYTDYGLYMASRPKIPAPEPKRMTVDIPGMDGVLDLTEANVGETKYKNRTLTFRFFALIDIEDSAELKHRLFQDLHGKKLEIILDEDSDYYYYGRCSVSIENETPQKLNVVVTVDAEPFKYDKDETVVSFALSDFTSASVSYSHLALSSRFEAAAVMTAFPVGNASNSCGDFSVFSSIRVGWVEQSAVTGISIVVRDKAGHTYTKAVSDATHAASGVTISASTITSAGVDLSDLLYVNVIGRRNCTLDGIISSAVGTVIDNGKMTVVPSVEAPTGGVSAFFNGKKVSFSAGVSKKTEAFLAEGENKIVFYGAQSGTVKLYFRRGWL